jgi:hypothetical protein
MMNRDELGVPERRSRFPARGANGKIIPFANARKQARYRNGL